MHSLPPSKATMKLALSVLALAATASAFAPASVASRGLTSSVATATPTQLFSEPEDEEEGLDLNLEEMFDMYVQLPVWSCACAWRVMMCYFVARLEIPTSHCSSADRVIKRHILCIFMISLIYVLFLFTIDDAEHAMYQVRCCG